MTKIKLFTDSSFPANEFSLYSKETIPTSDPDVHWRRMEDYVAVGTDLTAGTSSEDVLQGSLGDCWLLASIAAIADSPALIQRLFRTPRVNVEGRYVLRLAVDGLTKDVEVDSLLPFIDPNAGTLYSARQHHGRFWVALLEKALAKVAGGYDRLDSGDCEEALRTFTGCPTSTIESDTPPDKLWNKLARYGGSGRHLLTCGIDPELLPAAERTPVTPHGLLLNHVYTVLAAREHAPSGTRLLRLRNPWGKLEYRGAFSDGAPQWTPALRAFFRPNENPVDGVFHIGFEDFCRHFNVVSVCFTAPGVAREWQAPARVASYLRLVETTPTRPKNTIEAKKETMDPYIQNNAEIINPQERKKNKDFMVVKTGHVDSPTLELSLKAPGGKVYMGLHQLDEREKNAQKHVDAGAVVMDAVTGDVAGLLDVRYRRVVQQKLSLPAGKYHVVPYSSGVHLGLRDENERGRPIAITAHSESGATLRLLGVERGRADAALARALLRLGSAPIVSGDEAFEVRTLSTRDLMVVGVSARSSAGPGRSLVALFDPSDSLNIVPVFNFFVFVKFWIF